ncbi:MAG: ABC transporter permease subunit [Pseudonocardiaceae bacterium]|nr:ABC transporter permease subunit [Pseudonocardiaceae bacterium]
MSIFDQLVSWLREPNRWSFSHPDGLPYRVIEHLQVSVTGLVLAVLIAVPLAVVLAHHRKGAFLASAAVNIGRAIPSFGLIIIFWLAASRANIDTTFWPLTLAMTALALPPLFTNSYTGVQIVDPATVEASRGVGFTEMQILRRVEIPLALPVILAGARIAFVQIVATVAIGAIVSDGGGLGRPIVDGFAQGATGYGAVLAGGIAVAFLALLSEALFTVLERAAVPAGIRRMSATAIARR